jgi:hypothetical protein
MRRRGGIVCSPAQAPSHGRSASAGVVVVQGPAAAGAEKVLANTVHEAGGCFQVPHQARLTACAGRSHSPGGRAAGECETGLGGAGRSWAELGWGWAGGGMAHNFGLGSGLARAGLELDRVVQLFSDLRNKSRDAVQPRSAAHVLKRFPAYPRRALGQVLQQHGLGAQTKRGEGLVHC